MNNKRKFGDNGAIKVNKKQTLSSTTPDSLYNPHVWDTKLDMHTETTYFKSALDAQRKQDVRDRAEKEAALLAIAYAHRQRHELIVARDIEASAADLHAELNRQFTAMKDWFNYSNNNPTMFTAYVISVRQGVRDTPNYHRDDLDGILDAYDNYVNLLINQTIPRTNAVMQDLLFHANMSRRYTILAQPHLAAVKTTAIRIQSVIKQIYQKREKILSIVNGIEKVYQKYENNRNACIVLLAKLNQLVISYRAPLQTLKFELQETFSAHDTINKHLANTQLSDSEKYMAIELAFQPMPRRRETINGIRDYATKQLNDFQKMKSEIGRLRNVIGVVVFDAWMNNYQELLETIANSLETLMHNSEHAIQLINKSERDKNNQKYKLVLRATLMNEIRQQQQQQPRETIEDFKLPPPDSIETVASEFIGSVDNSTPRGSASPRVIDPQTPPLSRRSFNPSERSSLSTDTSNDNLNNDNNGTEMATSSTVLPHHTNASLYKFTSSQLLNTHDAPESMYMSSPHVTPDPDTLPQMPSVQHNLSVVNVEQLLAASKSLRSSDRLVPITPEYILSVSEAYYLAYGLMNAGDNDKYIETMQKDLDIVIEIKATDALLFDLIRKFKFATKKKQLSQAITKYKKLLKALIPKAHDLLKVHFYGELKTAVNTAEQSLKVDVDDEHAIENVYVDLHREYRAVARHYNLIAMEVAKSLEIAIEKYQRLRENAIIKLNKLLQDGIPVNYEPDHNIDVSQFQNINFSKSYCESQIDVISQIVHRSYLNYIVHQYYEPITNMLNHTLHNGMGLNEPGVLDQLYTDNTRLRNETFTWFIDMIVRILLENVQTLSRLIETHRLDDNASVFVSVEINNAPRVGLLQKLASVDVSGDGDSRSHMQNLVHSILQLYEHRIRTPVKMSQMHASFVYLYYNSMIDAFSAAFEAFLESFFINNFCDDDVGVDVYICYVIWHSALKHHVNSKTIKIMSLDSVVVPRLNLPDDYGDAVSKLRNHRTLFPMDQNDVDSFVNNRKLIEDFANDIDQTLTLYNNYVANSRNPDMQTEQKLRKLHNEIVPYYQLAKQGKQTTTITTLNENNVQLLLDNLHTILTYFRQSNEVKSNGVRTRSKRNP